MGKRFGVPIGLAEFKALLAQGLGVELAIERVCDFEVGHGVKRLNAV
jgi:hypothetical protein